MGMKRKVVVKCLSRKLSNTQYVFISTILLFNMQKNVPINMVPMLCAEVNILCMFFSFVLDIQLSYDVLFIGMSIFFSSLVLIVVKYFIL